MTLVSETRSPPWQEALERVAADDPASLCDVIADAARRHVAWHESSLSLVASRNLLSPRARAMMASGLMERVTGGGWVGERRKSGNTEIDRIEALLVELARKLFGVEHVEYRIPTGSIANAVFLFAATRPREAVLALSPRHGGHRTYGTGGYADAHDLRVTDIPCGDDDLPEIDLERLAAEAKRLRPRWILIGSSWPLFPYPLVEIRRIADGVGARILYDGAHILGLWAGGRFQDPLGEGAAAVTASTHKTFPGPVGGLILTDDPDLGAAIRGFTSRAIGNYHNQRAAALAVTLAEMLVFAPAYAAATQRNAQALAKALDSEGFRVLGKAKGFTQSHVVIVDLAAGIDPGEAWRRLEAAKIACEAIPLPRTYPQPAALRLGSPSLTRRGMGEAEMAEVARFLRRAVLDREEPSRVARDVVEFSSAFAEVRYCL